jgi:hypothetical protein
MKYSHRLLTLALAGVAAIGITASGCATPWFGSKAPKKDTTPVAATGSAVDLKEATVTYINNLCQMSREERDGAARELNEALLPNHASISCGRAGDVR